MATLLAMLAGLGWGIILGLSFVGVWSIVGFVVAGVTYYITPVPRASGPCAVCDAIQALWNRMNWAQRIAAFPNFVGAKALCWATSCFIPL